MPNDGMNKQILDLGGVVGWVVSHREETGSKIWFISSLSQLVCTTFGGKGTQEPFSVLALLLASLCLRLKEIFEL